MAIHRQLYRKAGKNAAAIPLSSTFATSLKIRLTDAERAQYGPANVLRIVNHSGRKLMVHWTWGTTYSEVTELPANGTLNYNVEDGIRTYGFDVYNLDAGTEVAIGELAWEMSMVLEVPEGRVNGL